MATALLSRIENDVTMTWEKASQELADVFSKPALMAENIEILPNIYDFLKEQPKLCELLFKELIKRHNAVASMSDTEGHFVPGCCCCGIDPYKPHSFLEDDVNGLETKSNESEGRTKVTSVLTDYRKDIHSSDLGLAYSIKKKTMAATLLFDALSSPAIINQEESDYLYTVLRNNECVAEDLYQYAISGARMATLLEIDKTVTESVVTRKVFDMFGEDMKSLKKNGGGCCCCCCCCCCGGGC